jgi:hypothetical protein
MTMTSKDCPHAGPCDAAGARFWGQPQPTHSIYEEHRRCPTGGFPFSKPAPKAHLSYAAAQANSKYRWLRAPATNNTDILPIATRPSAGACLQHRAVIVDGDRRMARFGGHQGQRPLHLPQVRAGKFTVFDTVHRVLACADDTSKVAESDNVNNCRASTTTSTIQ